MVNVEPSGLDVDDFALTCEAYHLIIQSSRL
ncbi:MAG: hypothetical protein ACI97B_000428, partial [Verrucomicrobiales bacterium]